MRLTTSICGAALTGILLMMLSSPALGRISAQSAVAGDWHKVDAGPFSILAPLDWGFHQLEGVDSFVGEFVGDSVRLVFDFGAYSNPLKEEKKPEYVVSYESIGGFRAKVVSPRTPGHGVTGIYFRDVGFGHRTALSLWGRDLTSAQQELALKIFETIRFGGPLPRYVLPLPPAKNVQAIASDIEANVGERSFWDGIGLPATQFQLIIFEQKKAAGEEAAFDALALVPELNAAYQYRFCGALDHMVFVDFVPRWEAICSRRIRGTASVSVPRVYVAC
jgi:hypothetical protein